MSTPNAPTAELFRADKSPGLKGRVRNHPVVTTVLVLFVILVGTLFWTQRPADYTPLSIENSTPTGTRALAQVLRDQGVDVRQASTMADARVQDPSNTTLVVVSSGALAYHQNEALAAYPGDIVFIDPSQPLLNLVAPDLSVSLSRNSEPTTAQCDDPDAIAAELVGVRGSGITGEPGPDGALCFPNERNQYAYAVVEHNDRRVTLLPSWEIVTNENLDQDGNAALALRALGRHPNLVWTIGDMFDPSTITWENPEGSEPANGVTPPSEIQANPDFLPPGAGSAFYVLGITVLLAAIWQARRFGPLVREPLPVVVRASEATRGRARLYRRARASGRATAALRGAAALRIARRLGVPRAADKEALVAAISRATNRPAEDVERVLYGPPPTNDSSMMSIIAELDTLESEVHRP